jgi:uncharacterized protein YkwD
LGLTVAVALTTVAVGPAAATTRLERRRDLLLNWSNDYRNAQGVRDLREGSALDGLAQRHSRRMADQRRLYHTADLGTRLRSYSFPAWGENVGYGPTMWGLFQAFLRSASHRANLLDRRYHRVGIGVVKSHGIFWVTMIFAG